MLQVNIEQINSKLEEYRITFLGNDWIWRKGQKEAIVTIVEAYFNGTETVILDCPTGGGKSAIAMASAWILNQSNKKGYILASDISLQEQYEKDLKKFNINWGSVKGIDNYICTDNMEKNSLGVCRIRNILPKKMYCYDDCPYFSARNHASKSPTALLNYAYWLIMMNYVKDKVEDPLFIQRDFTICDEGHKLLDIIQNHYSPRIDNKTLEKLEKLTHFFALYKIQDHMNDYISVKHNIKLLYNNEDNDILHKVLIKIEKSLSNYLPSWDVLKDKIKKDYPKDTPPKEWREAIRLCDWLKDMHCKIEDFNEIINKTSTDNIVKNPSNDNEIIFNCLEESYMINKYFHANTGFRVIMSATFADASKYLKSIALKNAKYIKLDSQFNFKNSPIYFYNKRRMSYNKIEANLPWMYEKINEILDKHDNENGIIHTASYDLTMKIFKGISKKNKSRILIYNGTEEKRQVLEELKINKNKIVIGPSLLEGLDLKDDWSRFQIFAKVPYLSLGDKFVSRKLNINPDWYRERAIISILQGAGRSIRSENDWAVTYILDGALGDLIHNSRKSFPIEFMQRIIVCE